MQNGINIDAIKQYNASLREYKEKSSKLRAEIEFSQKELDRQCKELSTELGIEVTPDNIAKILEDRTSKINNTILLGTEILDRIKAEENAVASSGNTGFGVAPGTVQAFEASNAAPAGTVPMPGATPGVLGMAGATPGVAPGAVPGVAPGAVPGVAGAPTPPQVSAPGAPNISDLIGGGLPPIFQNNGLQI